MLYYTSTVCGSMTLLSCEVSNGAREDLTFSAKQLRMKTFPTLYHLARLSKLLLYNFPKNIELYINSAQHVCPKGIHSDS